ncbi:MAG: helix-turn-helix domain-containing protein [Betaproteobacteria bacterium]|nr:helix-turn-helix domain-containing protein [Betaproteobacteria bacterium]MDE2123734.1 helix-turn-helix domain-containing protein [Betaproteobacteria bacterium]MDE2185194.1 helix-turn-helix domain-containing protein [Betaproteobacteria bacterium]MDE2324756.1 helix-turn-helix domain-containing protein [Betaproteobacteria bacterium]
MTEPRALPTGLLPAATPEQQRQHLGAFIRLHRQRLQPQAAGLAPSARRRTPGLRREELAQLCAVSTTWITWLEQGRDVAASAAVLARLAQALQLSAAERAYVFDLAGRRDPAEPAPSNPATPAVLRSVQALQCPAYVLDRRWDVVAANAQARELFLDWGVARATSSAPKRPRTREATAAIPASPPAPNLLQFLFLFPPARQLIDDWDARAQRLVAEFRADCGRHADSPQLAELIAMLAAASADFARCWQSQEVLAREGGERRFQHPRLGARVYEQLTLRPAVRSDLKLVMLLPPA